MNKKNTKTITVNPIISNTLKVKSPYVCPNCGKTHCIYVSEKGMRKVIDFGYSFKVGFLREIYYYNLYHCSICGYEWKVKKYISDLGKKFIIENL